MVVCQLHVFIQLRTAALRLIVRSWLDVPNFATRRLHACHHARTPSGGRWNCGREMSGNFAEMTTYTPFKDLLHVVKLRHGTEGIRAEDFFALKIWLLQPGVNPRTWAPKVSTLHLDHRSRLFCSVYTHSRHNSVLTYWLACKAISFLLMAFATPQCPPSISAWLNCKFGLISGKRTYCTFSPGFLWRPWRTGAEDGT